MVLFSDTNLKLARFSVAALPSMSLIPLRSIHPPPPMRYGVAGEFTLMIKLVASWCVTVRSGAVCDEERET
jgi:hypothetical protein